MSDKVDLLLDLTGSAPDSNGIEEIVCPFHTGEQRTMFLDHVRGAFLCFVCRSEGGFAQHLVNGRRIIVAKFERVRPTPADS